MLKLQKKSLKMLSLLRSRFQVTPVIFQVSVTPDIMLELMPDICGK
jgi:hypothetical protein